MELAAGTRISRRFSLALVHSRARLRPGLQRSNRIPSRRHASSSTKNTTSSSNTPSSDPIVLEKPDKFRPPSHPARLKARSTTGSYSSAGGGGGAYNQGMNAAEREASKTRKYPHMFPAEGSSMHWFLTTKWIHTTIALTTLSFLAMISMTHTFIKTSPFAHLLPSLSSLPLHPIDFVSETLSVYRLHMEYQTSLAAESRKQNILDAQKRRLYRRAHDMEDLSADEISGPDVRGLVAWDDGLTNPERERGGQFTPALIGSAMMEMGVKPGEGFTELMDRKRKEEEDRKLRREEAKRAKEEREREEEIARLRRIGARGYRDGEEFGNPGTGAVEENNNNNNNRRRRKVWFGIWG